METPLQSRRVWDLPVRLFHWLLVLLVAVLWFSGEFGGVDISASLPLFGDIYLSNMDVHSLAGQGVLLLLVFRILWGLWGSTTARFRHFIHRPAVIKKELTVMLKGRVPESTGHNPLGGVMVVILIILLSAQVVTGLFSADDFLYDGLLTHLVSEDTVDTMSGLHHQIFSALEILIILHIAAIAYHQLRGHNLITPMITGLRRKPVDEPLQFKGWGLGLTSLTAACILLFILRSL